MAGGDVTHYKIVNDVFIVATACYSPHSTQNRNCVGDIGDTFTQPNATTHADHIGTNAKFHDIYIKF